jgi:hypothetical protein
MANNLTVIQDTSMDLDTLKAELQHIFKELIGASLMKAREGKNSSHYSQLFESLMGALDDFESLDRNDDEPLSEEPAPRYSNSGFKVVESQPSEQNRNLKFIAEELLMKVEHLLQKVSEKDHHQRLPRDR